jgi:hypothetical protein
MLRSTSEKSESFVKNSGHFVELLKSVNVESLDTFDSFDAVSLLANVPVDEALQVAKNKLYNDDALAEQSALQVEARMELLEICLRTTYFQVNHNFQRKAAWLWEAPYHPSLETSWSILRNWLLTRQTQIISVTPV